MLHFDILWEGSNPLVIKRNKHSGINSKIFFHEGLPILPWLLSAPRVGNRWVMVAKFLNLNASHPIEHDLHPVDRQTLLSSMYAATAIQTPPKLLNFCHTRPGVTRPPSKSTCKVLDQVFIAFEVTVQPYQDKPDFLERL
jgi:hypothetical protein